MTLTQKSITNSIQKSYVVCSTGRSGSSLLCKTLASLGDCGNPAEYFHPKDLLPALKIENSHSFADYYLKVIQQGTTSNGVFGVKIHLDHFRDLLLLTRENIDEFKNKSDLEITEMLFPNPSFIYISRQDILRQAISTSLAFQTNIWGVNRKKEGKLHRKKIKPRFDPLNIYRYKVGLKMANRAWEKFFDKNSLPFKRVIYEDFVNSYESTIQDIYSFLEIEFKHNNFSVPTKKQANEINERWVKYYSLIPESFIGQYSRLRVKTRQWIERYLTKTDYVARRG